MHIVPTVDVDRFRNDVRAALRAAREGTALRQGQKYGRPALAKATKTAGHKNVNAQTIKNIEDGVTVDPGLVTIARILDALKIPLPDFFAHVTGASLRVDPAQAETQRAVALSRALLAYVRQAPDAQPVAEPVHESTPATPAAVSSKSGRGPHPRKRGGRSGKADR